MPAQDDTYDDILPAMGIVSKLKPTALRIEESQMLARLLCHATPTASQSHTASRRTTTGCNYCGGSRRGLEHERERAEEGRVLLTKVMYSSLQLNPEI